jgi:hypothetical protein
MALVLEYVCKRETSDPLAMPQQSLGWSFIPLSDVVSPREKDLKIEVYFGSPRALLYIDPNTRDLSAYLKSYIVKPIGSSSFLQLSIHQEDQVDTFRELCKFLKPFEIVADTDECPFVKCDPSSKMWVYDLKSNVPILVSAMPSLNLRQITIMLDPFQSNLHQFELALIDQYRNSVYYEERLVRGILANNEHNYGGSLDSYYKHYKEQLKKWLGSLSLMEKANDEIIVHEKRLCFGIYNPSNQNFVKPVELFTILKSDSKTGNYSPIHGASSSECYRVDGSVTFTDDFYPSCTHLLVWLEFKFHLNSHIPKPRSKTLIPIQQETSLVVGWQSFNIADLKKGSVKADLIMDKPCNLIRNADWMLLQPSNAEGSLLKIEFESDLAQTKKIHPPSSPTPVKRSEPVVIIPQKIEAPIVKVPVQTNVVNIRNLIGKLHDAGYKTLKDEYPNDDTIITEFSLFDTKSYFNPKATDKLRSSFASSIFLEILAVQLKGKAALLF